MSDIEPKICRLCGTSLLAETPLNICTRCALADASKADAEDSDSQALNLRDIPWPGQRVAYIGDYELLEFIARGGMGVVYKARQGSLNRVVALKLILGGEHASVEGKHRLQHEAQTAAKLQHPNIVAIYEVGEHEGQPFFSMEYVAGQDLAAITRAKPLPPRKAAEYLKAVVEAVQYAHEQGVLHRDLKPSNILIGPEDRPKVTDFGLARQTDSESTLTVSGTTLGTPGYLPPEQASLQRGRVGPRSDVYSLGAVLYHLLTGRPPFMAGTLADTLQQVLELEPAPLRRLNATIPADLETICLKCLEKKPEQRYASGTALAEDLQRWLDGEPILARPVRAWERGWKWARRHPTIASLVSILVLVLLASFIGVTSLWHRAEQSRTAESQANQHLQSANIHLASSIEALELKKSEELFAADRSSEALAYLARILRRNPANQVAAMRLISALTYRNFPLPVGGPMVHPDSGVQLVEFSPDGKLLATACLDGKRNSLWEIESGRLIAELPHDSEGRSVKFSPTGDRVVTASLDGTARAWDTKTGKPVGQPMRHEDGVNYAEFSPDGSKIVTAARARDGAAHLWYAATGKPICEPLRHTDNVEMACFSPDGHTVASAGYDAFIRIWDATSGTPIGLPLKQAGYVQSIEFSRDGRYLVAALPDQHAVCVWNLSSRKQVTQALLHDDAVVHVIFSPGRSLVATACWDWKARIWDISSGTPEALLLHHQARVWRCDFSPNGRQLLTSSDDQTARLWDVHNGVQLCEPIEHRRQVYGIKFAPSGQFLATSSHDGTAQIWNTRNGGALADELPHEEEVVSVQFSASADRVITVTSDKTVRVWDYNAQRVLLRLALGEKATGALSLSRDGRFVAVPADTTAQLWNLETGLSVGMPLHHSARIRSIDFSEDGLKVVTICEDGRVRVWSAETSALLNELPQQTGSIRIAQLSPDSRFMATSTGWLDVTAWNLEKSALFFQGFHGEAVNSLGFSPDGKELVSASDDSTVRVCNVHDGHERGSPLQHSTPVNSASFSPDGNRILTIPDANFVRLWDTSSLQLVADSLAHQSSGVNSTNAHLFRVRRARFSPDGKRLVTASSDGTAYLWDAGTGFPLSEAMKHNGPINDAAFSQDGNTLATASADRTVKIWHLISPPPRIPGWLPELAEAMAAHRLNERGLSEDVSRKELFRLKAQVLSGPTNEMYGVWAQWFFADRSQRSISPFSKVSVADFVERLIVEDTTETLQRAVDLSPTNGIACARLAARLLREPSLQNKRVRSEAEFLSHYAEHLNAKDPEVKRLRFEVAKMLAKP